jgi:hypothetical protein
MPALRAENCRRTTNLWQLAHLDATAFKPATQGGLTNEGNSFNGAPG